MEGWLLLLFFIAIGMSLVTIGLRRRAHLVTGFDDVIDEPLHRGPPALPPSDPVPTLPPDLIWLRRLLFALHALIIGQTRAGKTTITHFIATSRAKLGHRVIVCDPDAAPGMWPGCEVSGYEDDFAAIEQTLQALQPELAARRTARSQRDKARLTPLTLVLSEAGDIMNRCDSARDVFEQVLRRGGKLNISLLADVQDRQRDTLNIPGATHLLKNFEEQVEVYRDAGQRRVIYQGQDFPVPDLPDPEELADTYVQTHPAGALSDQATLADLLAVDPDTPLPGSPPQPQPQPPHQPQQNGQNGAGVPSASTATSAATSAATALPAVDMADDAAALEVVTPPAWVDEIAWICPDNDRRATKGDVLELLRQARTEPAIVKELWQIDGTTGARYKKALEVVATIRAAALLGTLEPAPVAVPDGADAR